MKYNRSFRDLSNILMDICSEQIHESLMQTLLDDLFSRGADTRNISILKGDFQK